MKERARKFGRQILDPVARLLHRLRIAPNHVTLAGFLLSAGAGAALATGRFPLAAALLIVGSLCDVLDGSLARVSGKASRFGAFLDSTMDRYAEMAVFMGLGLFFARRAELVALAFVFVAATGSLLVSYARARAEGMGLDCKVGLMERPERLLLIVIGAALGPGVTRVILVILSVLTHFTTLQRILHVRMVLNREAR